MKRLYKVGWFLRFDWFKNRNTIGQYFFSFERGFYSGDISYPNKHYSRTGSITTYSIMILFFGISLNIEK